jgi:hypothetical protein
VGRRRGPAGPFPAPFRIRPSGDNYPGAFEFDHCLAQPQSLEAGRPKRPPIPRPAQLGKATAQMKTVDRKVPCQPLPPAPQRTPTRSRTPRHRAPRLPAHQPLEYCLLGRPPILAPGGQTGRQPRAGALTRRAVKARDNQQLQREGHAFSPRRVAHILTMLVQTRFAAVGTAFRAIHLGIRSKLLQVLLYRVNS